MQGVNVLMRDVILPYEGCDYPYEGCKYSYEGCDFPNVWSYLYILIFNKNDPCRSINLDRPPNLLLFFL